MSTAPQSTPPSDDGLDHRRQPGHPPRRWPLLLGGVLALLLQFVVFVITLSFGLFWGAWTYLAALAQALVGFGVIAWLLTRRRLVAAMLVPLASAALTMGLLALTNLLWPERLIP